MNQLPSNDSSNAPDELNPQNAKNSSNNKQADPLTDDDEDAYLSMEEDQVLTEPVDLTNHHRLQYKYAVWHSQNRRNTRENFGRTLKVISSFETVEQFWSIYSYLRKPEGLNCYTDMHVFKHGVKPMWEDEPNRDGGRWLIRFCKGVIARPWENLLLAMLGEQFLLGDEICGAVMSIRTTQDVLSLWNRTANNIAIRDHIRDTLKRILNLPAGTILMYKVHHQKYKEFESTSN